MNYFEFFQIPVSFYPDKGKLRIAYIQNSKKLHPDVYEGEEEEEAMALTALNNKAYTTLSNLDKTVNYILDELYPSETKQQLPPEFLMEMMDTNEALMEAKMMEDQDKLDQIKVDVSAIDEGLFGEMETLMKQFQEGEINLIEKIRTIHLKRNYLKRLVSQL